MITSASPKSSHKTRRALPKKAPQKAKPEYTPPAAPPAITPQAPPASQPMRVSPAIQRPVPTLDELDEFERRLASPIYNPPVPVPRPDAVQPAVSSPLMHTGTRLEHGMGAMFMYLALEPLLGKEISPAEAQRFRDKIVAECETSSDPVERWLMESIALLQFVANILHSRIPTVADAALLTAMSSAATRTTAEMRRTIAALREYRAGRRSSKSSS